MSRVDSFMNLSPLNNTVYFGREFYCWVECVSRFNETFHFIPITVPKGENVINVTFPFSWLGIVLLH